LFGMHSDTGRLELQRRRRRRRGRKEGSITWFGCKSLSRLVVVVVVTSNKTWSQDKTLAQIVNNAFRSWTQFWTYYIWRLSNDKKIDNNFESSYE
jgi:hypothetical protein